jgi:hypothetical protein
LRLLVDKLKEINFSETVRFTIYLSVIDMLHVCAQESYPYHLPNVISNDQLYGSDPKFINEIDELCSDFLNELLLLLQSMSSAPRIQCLCALELFERVALKSDMMDEKMFGLAMNLWNLSVKNRHTIEKKHHIKVYNFVKSINKNCKNRKYQALIEELLNRIKNKL